MPRLPKFDRGLVVVAPHGGYIESGRKTALVKSRRYHMEDQTLLVIQNKKALGTIKLASPRAIDLPTFRALRNSHLVSEEERRQWWPRKTAFYLYEVQEFHPLEHPVPIDYPRGSQVFVSPENIWVV